MSRKPEEMKYLRSETLKKLTLTKTDIRRILPCGWEAASQIFDSVARKYKRQLPGGRILTADFLEATGIKKEGC